MKAKINLKNIIAYIQGNLRKSCYGTSFEYLLRQHIREQIKVRINSSNKECILQGACISCGCSTPGLQMSDKPCDEFCYPKMLDPRTWFYLQMGYTILIDKQAWRLENGKFKKVG